MNGFFQLKCCFFDQFQAGTKRNKRTATIWPHILLRTICCQLCRAEASDSADQKLVFFSGNKPQKQRKRANRYRTNRGRCDESSTSVRPRHCCRPTQTKATSQTPACADSFGPAQSGLPKRIGSAGGLQFVRHATHKNPHDRRPHR